MNIWHDITKETPPVGECVCILWNDGLITTDIWDESDIIDTEFQKYWSFSKELLPYESAEIVEGVLAEPFQKAMTEN